MNYKIIVLCICLAQNACGAATAPADKQLYELDTRNFDSFVKKYIPVANQNDFKKYYQEMLNAENAKRTTKRQKIKSDKRIQALAVQGKTELEIKEPKLYKQLLQQPGNEKSKKQLYVRYGAYQEFMTYKVKMQNSMYAKARTYVRDASTKVVSWVTSWRKPKVVA
ncbi:MAG: hypothetical protein BWY54_00779 [Candidatus Dependentiae bacterium ADurb.Bin331]|nr:MAG: hypothetical protein BWY54_00779 [Candidatus Dependentiae bacterium ADurb.Bin331]